MGCTHCAMIAQSTIFMHSEHGRSRVFQQWGDDDETIQIVIETCPFDCIHYIPYEELVALEIDRRKQHINPKARLVSQGENGNTLSHRVGGVVQFTAQQQISGNMASRCSNCPTRGCRTCPMYGVGKNPEYERKEKDRKERTAKRKLQKQRELEEKSIEL
jgi:ferredoxin